MNEQLKSFTPQELAVALLSHIVAKNTAFLRVDTCNALVEALNYTIKEKESLVFPTIDEQLLPAKAPSHPAHDGWR